MRLWPFVSSLLFLVVLLGHAQAQDKPMNLQEAREKFLTIADEEIAEKSKMLPIMELCGQEMQSVKAQAGWRKLECKSANFDRREKKGFRIVITAYLGDFPADDSSRSMQSWHKFGETIKTGHAEDGYFWNNTDDYYALLDIRTHTKISLFSGFFGEYLNPPEMEEEAVKLNAHIGVRLNIEYMEGPPPAVDIAKFSQDLGYALLARFAGQPEILAFELLDANPNFNQRPEDPEAPWSEQQLLDAATQRKGTVADGVSRLLVKLQLSEAAKIRLELEGEDDGTVEILNEGKTIEVESFLGEKQYFAYGLYTPPEIFEKPPATVPNSPVRPPKERLGNFLEVRRLPLQVTAGGGEPEEHEIILGRPPVVLVHGLFSDPVETWVKTHDDRFSMVAVMERAGLLPFLVNYQLSNGSKERGDFMGFALDASTYADNRSVVWDSPLLVHNTVTYEYGTTLDGEVILSELQAPADLRIGGIKQALAHYRDELSLAAAKASVVGHSMGGLLGRVWASPNYRQPGDLPYKRAENWMSGDILRLITLNTPHHGSELTELKDALGRGILPLAENDRRRKDSNWTAEDSIKNESWSNWAVRFAVNTVVWWVLDPEPGAIRDLRPESSALQQIGPTRVPAYAIATHAAASEYGTKLDTFHLYKGLYSLAGMIFFENRPLMDDFVENRFRDWQAAEDDLRRANNSEGEEGVDISEKRARERFKQAISRNLDNAIAYWISERDQEHKGDLRKFMDDTIVVPAGTFSAAMGADDELELIQKHAAANKELGDQRVKEFLSQIGDGKAPKEMLTMIHDLVFHHDQKTDGAVRVESQLGAMEEAHSEELPNILHSYSPWSYEVQGRVIKLLRWESGKFRQAGFEAAGQPLPRYQPSDAFSNARVEGEKAIVWSGLVPSHALEYLKTADRDNVVILARPVNRNSTQLLKNCHESENNITNCAAAKGMNVKGKSSNWGPHIGYIPLDQRYSKIWRLVKNEGERELAITKYTKETNQSVNDKKPEIDGKTYAVKRELSVPSSKGRCSVHIDPNLKQDAESGVLLHCGGTFYDWRNGTKNGASIYVSDGPLQAIEVDEERRARLLGNPLIVLADGTSDWPEKPYLTADYDLLAIGYPFEAAQCSDKAAEMSGDYPNCLPGKTVGVREAKFDKLRGFISPRQMDLVEDINQQVKDVGFTAGGVTHHGPEVQYPKSPYVDYPILVFDPNGSDPAGAYLVRMGPPGFRDLHLKRFFMEKNRQGYNLWPNPDSDAWRWDFWKPFTMATGYDPRDAPQLPPYIEETSEPDNEEMAAARAASGLSPAEVRVLNYSIDSGEALPVPVVDKSRDDPIPPKEDQPPLKTVEQSPTKSDDIDVKQLAQVMESDDIIELEFWRSVRDSTVADEFQAYLDAYPSGKFAVLARLRLKRYSSGDGDGDGDGGDGEKDGDSQDMVQQDSTVQPAVANAAPPEPEFDPTLNVQVETMSTAKADELDVRSTTGVVVTKVDETGRAFGTLSANDVILYVAMREVLNREHFAKLLEEERQRSKRLMVTISRAGILQAKTIALD